MHCLRACLFTRWFPGQDWCFLRANCSARGTRRGEPWPQWHWSSLYSTPYLYHSSHLDDSYPCCGPDNHRHRSAKPCSWASWSGIFVLGSTWVLPDKYQWSYTYAVQLFGFRDWNEACDIWFHCFLVCHLIWHGSGQVPWYFHVQANHALSNKGGQWNWFYYISDGYSNDNNRSCYVKTLMYRS